MVAFGDLEVDIRRDVQFKVGDRVLFTGDLMHLEKMANTQEIVVRKEGDDLKAYRVVPKMVFHETLANFCTIENFLEELPSDEQKRALEIYKHNV